MGAHRPRDDLRTDPVHALKQRYDKRDAGSTYGSEFSETEDNAPFPFSQDFDSRSEEQQNDDEHKAEIPHSDAFSVPSMAAGPSSVLP